MREIYRLFLFSLALILISCSQEQKGQEVSMDLILDSDTSGRADQWPPLVKGVEPDIRQISKGNYMIIFDGSGSMRGEKIATAKKALKRFIKRVPAGANVGLIAFDRRGCSERAPLGSDRKKLVSMVDQIQASGNTPLGTAITLAYKKLIYQANLQSGYGEYYIVILTDGRATDGSRMPVIVKKVLTESPVIIHTIGFHVGPGHPLNQPGQIYYTAASNLDELNRGFESVLAELEKFTVTKFE